MEPENSQVYKPALTNLVQLVLKEINLVCSDHPLPIDIVGMGRLLNQQLARVPRTSVGIAPVRLLKQLQ